MNIEEKEIKLTINAHTSPIQPPTPLTPSNSHRLNYTLFDHTALPVTNSWDWLNAQNTTSLIRKHSIQSDNSDFYNNNHPTATPIMPAPLPPLTYWRRSAPNGAPICNGCYTPTTQPVTQNCGHLFCHLCFNSISQNSNTIIVCPICTSQQQQQQQQQQQPPSFYMMNPSQTTTLRNFVATPPPVYPCVKLTNIPWDVSQNDVRHFFNNCRSPSFSTYSQSIHIMMDRTTGKTLSDAYVEFLTVADMRRAIETRHQKPLKGRIVSVSECSQEEFLSVVFPKWRGQFYGNSAIPPASEVVRTMSTAAGGGSSGCPPFITREEINSLLVVCKNYKLHFSRKCAERPFENIISVITKYPWHQTHLITTMHRDHIYEMLKLSIESLKTHLSKDYVQIDSTLLERLTRAGIMCPTFTERQKMTLLQTARIDCPPDIISYLVMSNPIVLPGLVPHSNNSEFSKPSPSAVTVSTTTAVPVSAPVVSAVSSLASPPHISTAATATTAVTSPSTGSSVASPSLPLPPPSSSSSSSSPASLSLFNYAQNESHSYWQKELDRDDSSSISSIIRDIQQCMVGDEKENLMSKAVSNPKVKPVLSPWAPSYSPKNDIWRMAPVESTHNSTKNLLTA